MDEVARKVNEDGEVTWHAFPGAYQVLYLMADGETLCPKCVEENLEQIQAAHQDKIHNEWPDKQWLLTDSYIHYEGMAVICSHCNQEFLSEYGDPDDVQEED